MTTQRNELVCFRLALLVAIVGAFGCGLYSGYCFYQSGEWGQVASDSSRRVSECLARPGLCLSPGDYQASYDEGVNMKWLYWNRAFLFLHLAWLVPVAAAFLFYALRWVLLGRIGPLWLREI